MLLMLPNWLLQWRVVKPMRYMVAGTMLVGHPRGLSLLRLVNFTPFELHTSYMSYQWHHCSVMPMLCCHGPHVAMVTSAFCKQTAFKCASYSPSDTEVAGTAVSRTAVPKGAVVTPLLCQDHELPFACLCMMDMCSFSCYRLCCTPRCQQDDVQECACQR